MAAANTHAELPYSAQRVLAKYEPTFRARLVYYLKQRQGDQSQMTWDDFSDALSKVFGELTSVRKPRFDHAVEERALADYRAGRFKTTKEWADELAGCLAD